MKTHKCDEKECRILHHDWCYSSNIDGYGCGRKKGHKGPHIACGLYEHNLAIWFDKPYRVDRDKQGFATAICKGRKVVLHLNPGTVRNEENFDEIVKLLNQ